MSASQKLSRRRRWDKAVPDPPDPHPERGGSPPSPRGPPQGPAGVEGNRAQAVDPSRRGGSGTLEARLRDLAGNGYRGAEDVAAAVQQEPPAFA